MKFFNRKSKDTPIVIKPAPTSRVEIEMHKGASEEAAKKADEVNEHVKELLLENGFTIKIAVVAGAQIRETRQEAT